MIGENKQEFKDLKEKEQKIKELESAKYIVQNENKLLKEKVMVNNNVITTIKNDSFSTAQNFLNSIANEEGPAQVELKKKDIVVFNMQEEKRKINTSLGSLKSYLNNLKTGSNVDVSFIEQHLSEMEKYTKPSDNMDD